ncbi:MAG: hypothetical protein ACX94A_03205 [Algiphilus sp.]
MSTERCTRRLEALEMAAPDARPNPEATHALAWLMAEHRATHPALVEAIESAPRAELPAAVADLLQAIPSAARSQFFALGTTSEVNR